MIGLVTDQSQPSQLTMSLATWRRGLAVVGFPSASSFCGPMRTTAVVSLLCIISVACSGAFDDLGAAIDEASVPEHLLLAGETRTAPVEADPTAILHRWYLSPDSPEETCDVIEEWGAGHFVSQEPLRAYCLFATDFTISDKKVAIFVVVLPAQTMIPAAVSGEAMRRIEVEHGSVVQVEAVKVVHVATRSKSFTDLIESGELLWWFGGIAILSVLMLAGGIWRLFRTVEDPVRELRMHLVAVASIVGIAVTVSALAWVVG